MVVGYRRSLGRITALRTIPRARKRAKARKKRGRNRRTPDREIQAPVSLRSVEHVQELLEQVTSCCGGK
jgi:hypothetical protein